MPLTNDPSLQGTGSLGDWTQLIGGLGALGGGLAQAGAQNNSASLAQQYAAMASRLGGFGFGTGPGGVSATGNPMGGGGNIGFGNFNPAYLGLAGIAGGNAGTAGGITAPGGLNPALSGAFGTAAGGLAGFNPMAPGMAGNADLLAASGLAGQAGQGFGGNVNAMYNALQRIQQPGNINAANSLGNSLFGRGMLGSSSGGILGQQFGQGLAKQSAYNAAQAQGLGLQALGTSANAAIGLTWMGSNALNSAFSNFGNAAMLGPNVQSSYLNPVLSGITGAGNLTNTGLGLYNAGLQSALGQNQAAARAGFLGTTNANSPNQQSPYGQLLGNMFGGFAQNAGNPNGNPLSSLFNYGRQAYNAYNNIFGGGSSLAMSPSDMASVYQGLDTSTATQLGSDFNPSVGSDLSNYFAGNSADAANMAANYVSTAGNASDLLSSFGFSPAGGEAATAGAGSAAGGAADAGATAYGADLGAETATADTGAAGAGTAAAGVSPMVAALPAAVMLAVAAHQNPTALNQNYWNGINQTLAAGPGSGTPNYGRMDALQPVQQYTQYEGALSDVFNAWAGQGQGNSTIPDSEWATLSKYGITPQNIGQYGMPDMGMDYWNSLSAESGVPEFSKPSRQGL